MNHMDADHPDTESSPQRRHLVGRPVAALGGIVRRWPVVTVASVLGLTAVFAVLAS